MISISIEVCGDDWVNREPILSGLQHSNCQEPVVLNLHAEGPSLHALGIVDRILDYFPADQVFVENWSNSVESVPFERLTRHQVSHFFWLSDRYQAQVPAHRTGQYLFGCFIGRRTVPRCAILKHIQENYHDRALLSLMQTVSAFRFSELDPLATWCEPQQFHDWYNNQTITSLDRHSIRDQYQGEHNTNASLLRWYSQFDIEIAAETYCHGDTFFVTEKTVRPIVAGKSLLVYGPKNYLARLRGLGFRTWNTVWDESYDQLAGVDRWCAMQPVLANLAQRNQTELYQQCQPIVEHNQQHAQLLINQHRPG